MTIPKTALVLISSFCGCFCSWIQPIFHLQEIFTIITYLLANITVNFWYHCLIPIIYIPFKDALHFLVYFNILLP